MSPERDVVVIGAGIAGATAAALLAKAGLGVTVCEAQPRPGGYLSGFERRGYTFDTSVVWLNQCGPGGLAHALFRHVGEGFPRCPPLHRIRRYRGESFDYLLTSDPGELQRQLARDHPAEAAGLERFFRDARELGLRWMDLRRRSRSTETMSLAEKARHGVTMLGWAVPVRRHLGVGAEAGLRRYFEGRDLERIFCTEGQLTSILFPIAWAYAGDFQAPPAGGAATLVAWLLDRAAARGAEIELGRRVARVLVERGRAVGVELETGDRVRCRHVLAACDVETLYERMLPAALIPQRLTRKLRGAELYGSHVGVFLGLDCDARSLGLGEEVVCLTRDDVSRADQSGGDPTRTSLVVVAPSVRDATLAPPGRGTLTIQCTASIDHERAWRTEPGMVRGAAYRELKQELANVLVERVERSLVPRLREHVAVMEVATPVTYQRYTGNRDGSIMGATPSVRNISSRIAHHRTPVPNVLLAGHWAEYGGGVPLAMKAAANASLIVLADRRSSAFEALCDVLDGRS
jgi:prolycopene isomerase